MVVANEARLRNRLRYIVYLLKGCWLCDRYDGNGGADGERSEGEGGDDGEGGTLGEFEAEKHDGIPFWHRCDPFTIDTGGFAACVPIALSC